MIWEDGGVEFSLLDEVRWRDWGDWEVGIERWGVVGGRGRVRRAWWRGLGCLLLRGFALGNLVGFDREDGERGRRSSGNIPGRYSVILK